MTQKPRKPRKDTHVPQSSDPIENVADEAVHKELCDSLVRAATTASSLEAEQDSGNINKTQSKATPNESSSQGTNSSGGPRCQETMGDTIAQTRVSNVFFPDGCEECLIILLIKREVLCGAQPPGFRRSTYPDKVSKLEKALYGLTIKLLEPV
ncbi:hypothetical protein Tco_1314779 [Tanacetum coccineum]